MRDITEQNNAAMPHPTAKDGGSLRRWERPAFDKIQANDAETGIQVGPEILILIS